MGLRRKIPAGFDALRAQVPGKERVMAWATGSPQVDGSPTQLIATDKALYAPGYVDRLEWQGIFKAEWDDPILEILTVRDGKAGWLRFNLNQAGNLPTVVFERVTATIVLQRHIELVGNRGASLVARRSADGETINWEVIFDAGLDPSDPLLRAQADEQLGWLRESVGI